ncbi:hypothetical protein ZIOFF_011185 [Zingiber officinale]|uniref:NB-ARC domain-containing protein n=1 Tax=Zingiber officinale TaxID=94328 RepID=A0A8J5LSK3_ZINOF|nr:hypothetical protein ZIOFF_011185 [Zingiber officinale]
MLNALSSLESQEEIKGLRGSEIDIESELEKLGKELKSMHSFVCKVEHKITRGALTDWVEQVQETSRKVEDILEQMIVARRMEQHEDIPEDILTEWLLHKNNVDIPRIIAMISSCGMGGLGKTSLAMKVYSKSGIKECFDCSAWVSMSGSCSLDQLMGSIARQVANDAIGPAKVGKIY